MQIETWPIDRLLEYQNNPRKNDHAVEAVGAAIAKYGFRVPILARSSGEIVDGHLRFKAARYIGLEEVPVLLADDMTEEEVRAFRISVNKMAELAKWDFKLLEGELKNLQALDFDLSTIGFSEVELAAFMGPASAGKGDLDALPEAVPSIAQMGDLWLLGEHRLHVGDATKEESYRRLLAEESVDLIWTDPPYNVDYSGKAGKIKNDAMTPAEFEGFLHGFFTQAYAALKPGGPLYVAHADGQPGALFRTQFEAAGFHLATCLIWRKHQATLGRSDYQYQHEPILYGWKPGAAHCWFGGRKQKSIIDFGEPPLFVAIDRNAYQIRFNNEVLVVTGTDLKVESLMPSIISIDKPAHSESHPTMKPVALVEHCLLNSSRRGDVVLDGFGGSGTTLIACELLGRRARILELDEKFADVIICRWQEYTGRRATLECGTMYNDLAEARQENAGAS